MGHPPPRPGDRIAVVGAGIAGTGAAWALTRAGFVVDVYERAESPGGNARTHVWTRGEREIRAGLAVLAWPKAYFRSYTRLLETLEVATEPVRLRFFVRRGEQWFGQGEGGPLASRYAKDFARWRRMVDVVRASVPGTPSLYRVSFANPFTYVPARVLARAFGISTAFWEDIVVAIYSSSFLTTQLDTLPAIVLPVIDDIVSVADGGRMSTWSVHSGQVFARMLAPLKGELFTGSAVSALRRVENGIELGTEGGRSRTYARVLLACDASSASRLVPRTSLARRLLARVRYTDDSDLCFVRADAHSDASVLPAQHRQRLLSDYCTFVDIVGAGDARRYQNHFLVSSWAPAARGSGAVMIVSYGLDEGALASARSYSNRRAHPDLSLTNLAIAAALGTQQGKDGIYYCGSYTTPGNGHDLSLLSGLVVADALGARYPFADDDAASADFDRLRRFMRF